MATPPPPESRSPTILIHVVSPNAEVPGRLVFADVPITETIANLKRRIQDAVPSKPIPERQRIIYRGRALVQHDITLQSVLGSEASNASEPFTFHLVLSPVESTHPPAGLRPDGLHQPLGLPTLPPHIHGARGLNMPPRPASTSQLPEGGQHPMPNIPNMPFNPLFNMIPQGLQPGQGVDIRMQFMQTGRPFPPHMPPGFNQQHAPLPNAEAVPGMNPQSASEQQMAMLQQQVHALHQQVQQNLLSRGHHHPLAGPINPNPLQHAGANINLQPAAVDPSQRRLSAPSERQEPVMQSTVSQQTNPTPTIDGIGQAHRQHATPRPLPPSGLHGLGPMNAANLHALRQNHLQNLQLDQMSQITQLRNALMNPSQPPRPFATTTQTTQTVYLLSSPSGPEALLVSPLGNFTSPHFTSGMEQTPQVYTTRVLATHTPQVPTQTVPQAQQALQPQQQQQQQQQPQDPAGELLRILLPLGGHLWLLVRLIGFVYLFSGGRGWRNTIVLGLLALIGFLAQTGVFNPLVRNVWRPIRQHVEGIINSEHPRPRPVEGQDPDPQQMADRLLERQGNQNAIRRAVRRMERSTILFAASLIPGVGESQVRARERAAREQREAEEAAERARQEAEQQAQNDDPTDDKQKEDEISVEKVDVQDAPSGVAQGEQALVE